LKDWYDIKKFFTLKTKTLFDFGHPVTFASKGAVKLGEKKTESGSIVPQVTPDTGSWARFTTAVNRVGLDLRVWADGRIKLGWDAGYLNDKRDNINVYGMFRTNHKLSLYRASLGLAYSFPANGYVAGRVKVNEKNQVILDCKALYRHNNWRVFENYSVNVNTHEMGRYNGIIDYSEKDFDISVAHDSLKKTLELGRVVTSVIYRYDKYAFAAQLRVKNKQGRFIFGFNAPINKNVAVKAKIDNRAKLTTAARFKLANSCWLSAATQVRLAEGSKALNFNKVLPLPFGLTLDWTF